jgi:hypothetical protein
MVPLFDAYSVAFLDVYLKDQSDGLTKLMHQGRSRDVSDLRSRE